LALYVGLTALFFFFSSFEVSRVFLSLFFIAGTGNLILILTWRLFSFFFLFITA
jgi:hypothetical protein